MSDDKAKDDLLRDAGVDILEDPEPAPEPTRKGGQIEKPEGSSWLKE